MLINQPQYWTPAMPAYHSNEGWLFEKERAATIIRLKVKLAKIDKMINKAELMRKASFEAQDTRMLCKYALITLRLYEASGRIAETLIFDYLETLEF